MEPSFLTELKNDGEVTALIDRAALIDLFDMSYHTKNVGRFPPSFRHVIAPLLQLGFYRQVFHHTFRLTGTLVTLFP